MSSMNENTSIKQATYLVDHMVVALVDRKEQVDHMVEEQVDRKVVALVDHKEQVEHMGLVAEQVVGYMLVQHKELG